MKKTLKVEGMMCGHCEARVKKALEALPEVDEAVVSHEAGTAIVTLNAEVADDVLKKAVEDQDYPVTGIQYRNIVPRAGRLYLGVPTPLVRTCGHASGPVHAPV